MKAWVGTRYPECGRVLILLESTYGAPDATQHGDVEDWIATGNDATFSRLHRVLAEAGESRRAFFDRFACMNVVDEPIGATNASKVTPAQLRAGAATLPQRLHRLAPRTVWLATKRARDYAAPHITARLIATSHPLYPANISDARLREAWAEVNRGRS
jgi:hypothetical protein